MMKETLLVLLVLGLAMGHPHQNAECPARGLGHIEHEHLTVHIDGTVKLVPGDDVQCYNHTFMHPFNNRPGVAVSLSQFDSKPTNDLFFSIKPIRSDSFEMISFVIRTQWRYTNWAKLSFSFLAEDMDHLEAGYYQLDTASLSGCVAGKAIHVLLPFRTRFSGQISAQTFLHGFQISSQKIFGSQSPFEVQVINTEVNTTGIAVTISTTTVTQVHSILVSFIAYDSSFMNAHSGSFIHQTYISQNLLQHTPSFQINGNTIDFYGLNGFIINNHNGADINLSGILTSVANSFAFTSSSNYQYLSFNYFFITGGACSNCPGFPIYYLGKCVANCPLGSYHNGFTCIVCAPSQTWNGTYCINRCLSGQFWNNREEVCQCPRGSNWNGIQCVTCPPVQTWSLLTNKCECPPKTHFNGTSCVSCQGDMTWNAGINACTCPNGKNWNGFRCIQCLNGQVWNSLVNQCGCSAGQYWNGFICQVCLGGQIWNKGLNNCTCPEPQQWNGSQCIITPACPKSQIYNLTTNICECPQNTYWNGNICLSQCPKTQIYNPQKRRCECPSLTHWNGSICVTTPKCPSDQFYNYQSKRCQCPSGSNWDGSRCVSVAQCPVSQFYHHQNKRCECPSGTSWNGTYCAISCLNGKIMVNGQCVCVDGTYLLLNGTCAPVPTCELGKAWNGDECVPIQCQPGYFWNGKSCSTNTPTCPINTEWNGFSCIPKIFTCPQGMIWNRTFCQTVNPNCQSGYFWDGTKCFPLTQSCPQGTILKNGQCVPIGNHCPDGSYYNGFQCIRYKNCPGDKVFDLDSAKCMCPIGTFESGEKCIRCNHGQIYGPAGCFCPEGFFFDKGGCVEKTNCDKIPNSYLDGDKCICHPGFTSVGTICECLGLKVSQTFCDRCYLKPNSSFKFNMCQCNDGYAEFNGKCVKNTVFPPATSDISCNVATYFDTQQKRCLPCAEGCLACTDCYHCTQCIVHYNFNFVTKLCIQECGDGVRYSLECDDGNNINGDGCSSDCKVEQGYTCKNGSPNSADSCSIFTTNKILISSTGQSHLFGKIILNIRLNHVPKRLLQSATACKNKCDNVLSVNILSANRPVSIVSSYIAGTSYSFSVEIIYYREPIDKFTVQIGINPSLSQYFNGIDITQKLTMNVNPAFLSVYQRNGDVLN